jgi:CHAT domain-containing protein/uncharacterized protein HemY
MTWRFLVLLVTTFVISSFAGMASSEPITQSSIPSIESKSQDAESLIVQGTQQLDHYFLDEAKVSAERALALSRDRKDRLSEGKALVLLGNIAYKLYDSNDRAAELANQGLAIAREVKDAALEARALLLLSDTMTSDDNEKKQDQTQRALELSRQAKDRRLEAEVLISLSDLANNRKEYEKVSDLVQQALTVAKIAGDRSMEFRAVARLGNLQKLDKEYDRALEFYNQAVGLARSYGNHYDEAVILGSNFVNLYEQLKNIPKQVEYKQKALQAVQQAQNHRLEAFYLVQLGAIYYDDLKDYDKALEYWQKAIAVAKDAKAGSFHANALKNIGLYYLFQKKNYNKAIAIFQEGLEVAKADSNQAWESELLSRIGQTYKLLGDQKQSLSFYQKSAKIDYIRDKRNCNSDETMSLAVAYDKLEDKQKKIEVLQQAIAIEQKSQNRSCELKIVTTLAEDYLNSGQTKLGIDTYQWGLSLARVLKERKKESELIRSIGYSYLINLKDYEQAQNYYQQALAVTQELKDRESTSFVLFRLASIDKAQKRYSNAIDKYQQTLKLTRELRDFSREIEILQAMSEIYAETNAPQQAESLLDRLIAIAKKSRDPSLLTDRANEKVLNSEPKNALKLLQSAIAIARETDDKFEEGRALLVLGNFHFSRSEYQQSLEISNQSLAIAKQLKKPFLEAINIFLIGSNYNSLGENKQAIEYLNNALSLFREEKNRSFEGQVLAILSASYTSNNQPRKGLELAQQSLKIAQETKNALFQTTSILALALAHQGLNDLRQAYELAQQAFSLAQEYKNPFVQMQALAMQESIFSSLGDNRKALDYAMQGLAIIRQMQSNDLEASSLSDIANLYKSLNEPAKALEYAEKALALAEKSQNPKKKISARKGLAGIYASQKRYDRAIALINEAQAIADKLEATESNRLIKRRSLTFLGYINRKLGKLEEAKAYLEEDLAIPQPADQEPDPDYGIGTKLELARVYLDLKQPNKAAPLYQEVIANTESKRKNIRTLSADLQKSFVQDTIDLDNTRREDLYREYASVLLSLDRIAEAQQVLDLLKVQELAKFVQTSRSVVDGFAPSSTASPVQGDRQHYEELLATAVSDGKDLEELRKTPPDQRNAKQKQRLEELAKREKELNIYFNQFVDSPEVTATVEKLNRASNVRNINLDSIKQISNTLKKIPNSVLLYPFILEDRIELILTTADAPPIHRTVKIARSDLSKKILQFLGDVRDPQSEDVKKSSQELYNILIRPIESDLNQAGAKTIIYAPDGLLRYIPIAALYDGKQWLVERYATNIITANNLTNLEPKISRNFRVLAGAFPPQDISLKVDNRTYSFVGLKSAIIEVNQIAKNFPNTTKLLGASFKRVDTEKELSENNFGIVHLATHGNFIPDAPQNSFIVFGDGESIKLKDIRNWTLKNVDLVVLSACQTALGSIKENSEGVEVVGLGFYLTESGAKAVIATLWKIDDTGTEALMGRFYTKLSQADLPSVEVLRQAQIDMIRSQNGSRDYSHPYYWAPFILIGNGF